MYLKVDLLNNKELKQFLAKTQNNGVNNLQACIEDITDDLEETIHTNIETGYQTLNWKPLSETTIEKYKEIEAKKRIKLFPHKGLVFHGDLNKRVSSRVGKLKGKVFSNTWYHFYHEMGIGKLPKRESFFIALHQRRRQITNKVKGIIDLE